MSLLQQPSSQALLDAALSGLGFEDGHLLPAEKQQTDATSGDWIDSGDWLALARFVGVEKVFFVDHNPVVVFARSESNDEAALRDIYNRIWCMARPQLLFLARPGELAVYDLSKPPVDIEESINEKNRLLSETVRTVAAVQTHLSAFRREEIESGRLFEDPRFAGGTYRADKALIQDLRIVREKLLSAGLSAKHAHALIGRSIFIRYLEDREILLPEYFEAVATRQKGWTSLLAQQPQQPLANAAISNLRYLRVLGSKSFAYALFDQLASDFNGDTFPVDADERSHVTAQHLGLLRDLLLGDTTAQQKLFFFAYKFDVIPIELISSIYEEFYNEQKGKENNHGSHYTPSVLVDFLLARTLTPEVLERTPRVMDPSCGSGIFLVEAFRRIVRYQMWKQGGKRLSRPQLRRILRDQVFGIDINEEAIRVAAFSLYLAFLHYQEPREINEQRRLPNLKWSSRDHGERDQYFDILLHGNAFEAAAQALGPDVAKRFGPETADIVVGNPPWGYPKSDDELGRNALRSALAWCREHNYTIGDQELSQAFIHLALHFLRKEGKAGFLVSSGVFFKHHPKSRRFREEWLTKSRLDHVVNFAQVRHLFFRGSARKSEAIAPFASVVFSKESGMSGQRFTYWSAKRTAFIETTQAVVLSRADMNWLSQQDCVKDEYLWKIYWWGSHRDEALIRSLERYPSLVSLPHMLAGMTVTPNIGFVKGKKGKIASDWLKEFNLLPSDAFQSYGPLDVTHLGPVPDTVRRRGSKAAYQGHRLLVRRGIQSPGKLTARLEDRRFCFTHSIFAFSLVGFESWQEKALLGILWSSYARYYLFLTTGSWGMWHDELNMEMIGKIPISLPRTAKAAEKIVRVVESLQSVTPETSSPLFGPQSDSRVEALERALDEAVFDLYQLNVAERDLIRDMCNVGLDLLYRKQLSAAVKPLAPTHLLQGTDVEVATSSNELDHYLQTFMQIWNASLAPDSELRWQIVSPGHNAPLFAILFTVQQKSTASSSGRLSHTSNWAEVLALLDRNSLQSSGSRDIYTDSFVRLTTKDAILLIKRNERRFWTRSAARQDAEATQLQAMFLQGATT